MFNAFFYFIILSYSTMRFPGKPVTEVSNQTFLVRARKRGIEALASGNFVQQKARSLCQDLPQVRLERSKAV